MTTLPALPAALVLERELAPGRTYLVRDRRSAGLMVLKRCAAERRRLEPRLRALPRAATSHLVAERELLELGGFLFSLRPYVGGETLRAVRAPLESRGLARTVELLQGVAAALTMLHKRGLAHGRLHSRNVVVDARGQPRLIDCLDPSTPLPPAGEAPEGETAELSAAPEQLRGDAPSSRSDVYALGLLTFELVTGRHPFTGDTPLELTRRALYEEVFFSLEEEQRLPAGVVALVQKALARKPHHRFSSAARMAAGLRSLTLATATTAPLPLQDAPSPPPVESHSTPPVDAHAPPPLEAHSPLPLGEGQGEGAVNPLFTLSLTATTARIRGALHRTGTTAELLARTAFERWWRTHPRIRVGAPVLAGVALFTLLVGVQRHQGRALEHQVEELLERNETARARELLLAEQRRGEDDVTVDKLLGDVACARGDGDECLHQYRKVLERSSQYDSDARLQRNTLALMDRADRRWLVAQVAAKLEDVDDALEADTLSEHYWKRWNAVRALEARGAGDRIPYGVVYALDVLHAGSCATRRAALAQLAQLKDPESLPHLQRAREKSSGFLFGDTCVGGDLERVIRELESAR
ncbi:MAG: protein kinase [Myxococcaceae bacterium]|nr:protein kinase [Myxococcaceae bacterium]MCI0673534.1 protein kinase [Myxococcaceae bacterium]